MTKYNEHSSVFCCVGVLPKMHNSRNEMHVVDILIIEQLRCWVCHSVTRHTNIGSSNMHNYKIILLYYLFTIIIIP